eukprot:scaffold1984_cov162-Amphora_coffeaeformis.AAC.9
MKINTVNLILLLLAAPVSARLGDVRQARASPKVILHSEETSFRNQFIVAFDKPQPGNKGKSVLDIVNERAQARMPNHVKTRLAEQYTSVLNGGFVFTIDDSASEAEKAAILEDIASDPDVAFVEQDQLVEVNTATSVWGIDRIDDRAARDGTYEPFGSDSCDASSVRTYIIDTGIRLTHNEFTGRLLPGVTISGATDTDGSMNGNDCQGHGTHVAGTVGGSTVGVASNVELVPVRVFKCSGGIATSVIISGIEWALNDCPNKQKCVANLSVGGGYSSAQNAAIKSAYDQGMVMVVAAGNNGADACSYSPSSEPTAITVGAVDRDTDARSGWSNYGSCVDIFAPGMNIRSASHTDDTSLIIKTGTSMASPHVAGAAACYRGNHDASPAQVVTFLKEHATMGVVTNLGGSPDGLLYIGSEAAGPVTETTVAAPVTTTASTTTSTAAAPVTTTTTTTTTPATTTTTTTTRQPVCTCNDFDRKTCDGQCGGRCWFYKKGGGACLGD